MSGSGTTTATAEPFDFDELSAIMAYEAGELDKTATLELFGHLIRTGRAWKFQGHYGRMARDLIEGGHISASGEVLV